MGIMKGRENVRGFTMVELLIVIMVISLLAGIAIPAAFKVREQGRRIRAQAEVNAIARAVELYFREYGSLPLSGQKVSRDFDIQPSVVLPALLGQNLTLNPKGIVFLEFDMADNPSFQDPWGRLYSIRADTNYNGFVAPFHLNFSLDNPSQGVRALMLVGTPGQDGVWGTESDIVSSHSVD